ncbi:SEC14-like protein 2 [Rhipicephalus sanguineus]|uniref:SEC14-like protein 2 n=1 Tax=Rhipicephalus sanguineus TaxID=34632 RepID=UPI0018931633|nr:SEC14-like protein 2 [Rhipicephalus sanguineus]
MSAVEDDAAAVADRLTAKEQAALDQFRISTADLSLPSREDWYLVKWLRARKFDTKAARKMVVEHIAWRKKNEVDSILEDYQPPKVLLEYFPGGFVDCSTDGRPVLIVPVGQADFKGMLEAASRADLLRHCTYLLESQEELKRNLTLQNGGPRIETMHVVADMEGFSFWQLSSLEVVSALTDVVRMYEDNFPEILEQAYLVNAPSLFPLLWNIIKPLLTQRTMSKVHIFGKGGWQELLTSRMNVQRLPVQWGGKLTGPDGDERCRNLICPGGTIPDKYRRKRSEAAGAESHTVGAGSSWTLPVSVARAGSELRWDFCTSSGDLKFAVRFRPNDGGAGDVDESRDLVPRTMVPCSRREPHSGSVHCHEPGTYELVFDNSYSWLTRKEVSSSVKLLPPPTRSET